MAAAAAGAAVAVVGAVGGAASGACSLWDVGGGGGSLSGRSYPISLAMLSAMPLRNDGAAAVILSHPDVTPNAERPRSRIAGSGVGTDFARLGDRNSRYEFRAKQEAAHAAYKMAGINDPAHEIDIAEVYDPFTGAELQSSEALGLVAEGQAVAALQDGLFDADGSLPVNRSGGLIGQGGVPGATGIAQAISMDRLLTGRYPGQAPNELHRCGVIDSHGGICTLAAVHVLERLEP